MSEQSCLSALARADEKQQQSAGTLESQQREAAVVDEKSQHRAGTPRDVSYVKTNA
jgi:hypothetical protein